jgi:hypothetical protein
MKSVLALDFGDDAAVRLAVSASVNNNKHPFALREEVFAIQVACCLAFICFRAVRYKRGS